MDSAARWEEINALDEELMKGGYILSEWCVFITKQADIAYARGADLASILTAMAAIETYLRSEYPLQSRATLAKLIDKSLLMESLKDELHKLRRYRNKWVHVDDPGMDEFLIENPKDFEDECRKMALRAARAMRQTIYENPWV